MNNIDDNQFGLGGHTRTKPRTCPVPRQRWLQVAANVDGALFRWKDYRIDGPDHSKTMTLQAKSRQHLPALAAFAND